MTWILGSGMSYVVFSHYGQTQKSSIFPKILFNNCFYCPIILKWYCIIIKEYFSVNFSIILVLYFLLYVTQSYYYCL